MPKIEFSYQVQTSAMGPWVELFVEVGGAKGLKKSIASIPINRTYHGGPEQAALFVITDLFRKLLDNQ